jgi:hypothetical protein
VALAPFLARFRAALEPRARLKGLALEVEVAPGTPEVRWILERRATG